MTVRTRTSRSRSSCLIINRGRCGADEQTRPSFVIRSECIQANQLLNSGGVGFAATRPVKGLMGMSGSRAETSISSDRRFTPLPPREDSEMTLDKTRDRTQPRETGPHAGQSTNTQRPWNTGTKLEFTIRRASCRLMEYPRRSGRGFNAFYF